MICQFSAPFFSCLLIFYLFTIAFDDDFVSCCWFFDQFAMFSGLIFQLFADCLIICRVFWPCICHVFWPDLSAVADFWKFHDPVGSSHNFYVTLCFVFDPVALFPRQVVSRFLVDSNTFFPKCIYIAHLDSVFQNLLICSDWPHDLVMTWVLNCKSSSVFQNSSDIVTWYCSHLKIFAWIWILGRSNH